MSRSKGATPVAPDHPANKLTFVDEEIKNQLLKTPPQLLLESGNYKTQLQELRSDWRFAFVLQWLTFFPGAIKLSGEPFTVDLVEEELVGLTEPNLIPKIATNLAAALIGTKVSMNDFGFRVRYLFGESIDLLGTEDEPKEFDELSLIDKFDVLYRLIDQLQYTEIFRNQVEKYERENELRFEPIFEKDEESFFLLSDNRIYKRILSKFPKLNIPKKYKNAKKIEPEIEFPDIEPLFEWENVAIGIYEIHDFLESIKSIKKYKPLFNNIKEYINDIANDDLTTRKKIVKRKREQQLNELVSHRKRSSRIQMKEEQSRLDKEREEAERERQKQEQLKAKLARKAKQKENQIKRDIEEHFRRSTSTRRGSPPVTLETPSNLNTIELEEGEWLFECGCGIREKNYDDGVKLIVCERCQRWQHLKCQDRIIQQELVRDTNEVFICNWCKQDFEVEVLKKLEDEKIQKQMEAEEKARQKELRRQLEEEERQRQEELERIRKEELEKERQRRILEREKAKESPAPTPSPGSLRDVNYPQVDQQSPSEEQKTTLNQQPSEHQQSIQDESQLTPHPQLLQQLPQQHQPPSGQPPQFGSFQVSPQQHYQPPPQQFQPAPHQQQPPLKQFQFQNGLPQYPPQGNFQQFPLQQYPLQQPTSQPQQFPPQPFTQHQHFPPQHAPQQNSQQHPPHGQAQQPAQQQHSEFGQTPQSDHSPSKSYTIQNLLQ